MEKQKQELIQSAGRSSLDEFVQLIKKFKAKNDSFNIAEIFQMFSRKESETFWLAIESALRKKLTEETSPEEIEELEASETERAVVSSVITAAQIFLKEKSRVAPAALLNVVTVLHNQMLLFDELSASIASLCEDWYLQERDGRDALIPSTLIYLLAKSTHPQAKAADVKRVWGLRNGLRVLDLKDESSIPLKRLLLACLIHPLYLRTSDGRKFLVYLFSLYLPLVQHLHSTIKTQIPSCRKSLLDAYGEVYFKAWKNATGPFLVEIETRCIQDLIHEAVHVANASLSQNIRRILNAFHDQKKQRGVDEMLLRLYEPILWRSLSVANAQMRKQAAALLIAAFPLQNPDSPQRETDELMQTQFEKLQALLNDNDISVRVIAVEGTAKILGLFWELIPVATQQVLVQKLTNDLAFDATSGIVRAAVLDGLRFILDNHLSHVLLKGLLPNLANLLHDKVEKVRVAMMELLLYVKSIREIKFYNICSIDHLLARLGTLGETPAVCKRITQLLLSSFFPIKENSSEQVKRCLVLLQTNAAAAKTFYLYLNECGAPVPLVAKFIAALQRSLISANSANSQKSNKENGGASDNAQSPLADPKVIDGVLQSMASLWQSICVALKRPENEAMKKFLEESFNDETMKQLSALMRSTDSTVAVLQIASLLPESVLPSLSASVYDRLLTLANASTDSLPLIKCLFSWNRGGQVLDLIGAALDSANKESTVSSSQPNNNKRRRPKNATENANEVEASAASQQKVPSTTVSFQLIGVILSDEKLRKLAVENVAQKLDRIADSIAKKWLPYLVSNVPVDEKISIAALEMYSRILLHRASAEFHIGSSGEDDAAQLEAATERLQKFVVWFSTNVVMETELRLKSKKSALSPFDYQVLSLSAAVSAEIIACGFTQKRDSATESLNAAVAQLKDSIIDSLASLLNKTNDEAVIRHIVPVCCKVVYYLCASEREDEEDLKQATDLLELAVRKSPVEKTASSSSEENKSEQSLKICLGEVISLSAKRVSVQFVLDRLFKPLLASVPVPDTFPSNLAESIHDLPDKAALVLDRVSKSAKGIESLAANLCEFLKQNPKDLSCAWKVLEIISAVRGNQVVSDENRNDDQAPQKKSAAKPIDQKSLNEVLRFILGSVNADSNATIDENALTSAMIRSAAQKLIIA